MSDERPYTGVKIKPLVARELSASCNITGQSPSELVEEILDLTLSPIHLKIEGYLMEDYRSMMEDMVSAAA